MPRYTKVTVAILALGPLTAAADNGAPQDTPPPAPPPVPTASWHVTSGISLGIEHFHYAEYPDSTTPADSHMANLPTAQLSAEVTSPHSRLFARGTLVWTSGSMTYVGETQAGDPVTGPTAGDMTDADLLAGARGHLGRYVMLGGFVEYMHHTWDRDLRPLGQSGYREQYAWSYLGPGVRLDVAPAPRVTLGFEAAAFLAPRYGSLAATDSPLGIGDTHFELAMGLAARVGVTGAYVLTRAVRLTAIATCEWSGVAMSNTQPLMVNGTPITDSQGNQIYFSEPLSYTTRATLAVGAAYAF